MKSLAFAADAEELIFFYGFSMLVSPFDRLGVPDAGSVRNVVQHSDIIIAQTANLVAENNSRPMSTR
jgi:hypothetical protein